MVIYDGLLSDQKIILAGSRNLSISQIQSFIYAFASLVSPPILGIHNKLLPYVPLSAMTKLEGEEGFLAGVMNPMFIENRKYHDIAFRIDVGKLNADLTYREQPYYELDKEFFYTINQRIIEKTITDEEIRQAFQSYT